MKRTKAVLGELAREPESGMDYSAFIASKSRRFAGEATDYTSRNPALFPFQRDLVDWCLARGRSALFADCGLGKTIMELEWATNVPGRVLLLAPIAVSHQIEAEAKRFGFESARVCTSQDDVGDTKIAITNYEKLHRFDPSAFDAIALDESSILKAYDGKTRRTIVESFAGHRWKLAATATPSPNDFMELGNHAEFLGAMTRQEMLSMFFVHDGGSTQDWRVKGHAARDFWRWVGSWSRVVRKPSDLGYDDTGFILPALRVEHHSVESTFTHAALIPGAVPLSLHERRRARRESLSQRVSKAVELDADDDQTLLWCDLNAESEALGRDVRGATEIRGADTEDTKREAFLGFAAGNVRALVTKPRIGGWGMNWQSCARMIFVGISDSYEAFYQCTRRCWRFGQKRPVDVHIVYSEHERAVVDNVLAKEARHREMQDALVAEVMR